MKVKTSLCNKCVYSKSLYDICLECTHDEGSEHGEDSCNEHGSCRTCQYDKTNYKECLNFGVMLCEEYCHEYERREEGLRERNCGTCKYSTPSHHKDYTYCPRRLCLNTKCYYCHYGAPSMYNLRVLGGPVYKEGGLPDDTRV